MCPVPPSPSQTCAENNGDAGVDSPTQTCPLADAAIVEIKWVDGGATGSEALVDSATQWVNLPRDAKWVDAPDIPNIDRLGRRPRLKVKFDKPGAHAFKVKLLAPTGTPAYTATETGRNAKFTYTADQKSFTTDANGEKIFDGFDLVVGGGYAFKAEAEDDKGKKVRTGDLTTKRLVWFTEAKMSGLAGVLGSTADVESEYDSHHLKLKKLADLAVAHQENIGDTTDSNTLKANADAAVSASAAHNAKKPHLLVNAYTDHLAVKNAGVVLRSAAGTQVGPGKPAVRLAVRAAGLRPPNTVATRYLWHDIVTGEGWFVSASYAGGAATVAIPQAKVTHAGTGDYWNEVVVDVTGLPAGAGQITVTVNVVDRMRGGLAFGGAMTCVCTKAWWATQSAAKQKCVVVHEIGHKVQQVTKGTGGQPDRAAKQYDNSGHVGSHCHQGCAAGQASYATSANLTASTCVMFGTVNQRTAFCADCAPGVKKVDITAGW
ncbi:hypothetical protein [Rubrimonas cliftonensis]|uniref:Uncharacterized protein n=1 Tax=Rubrimonas cliftonensis TaxID=89524 RepID=A0A1H4DK11_9RHOB|nr:hypothetical protein [Rubrimonas cliftonensis]SEA72886.1 hypothetical protein SAMN05444370_11074 [Rubrimonas cliftonensis]